MISSLAFLPTRSADGFIFGYLHSNAMIISKMHVQKLLMLH